MSCPECGNEDMCDVLSARETKKGKLSVKFRCRECGAVFTEVLHEERDTQLKLMISRDGVTEPSVLSVPPEEHLKVGQELYVGGERIKITAIEVPSQGGLKRVNSARADEISAVWGMNYDAVRVNVSINHRSRTIAKTIVTPPEEEFIVGEDLYIDDLHIVIHKIIDTTGKHHRLDDVVEAKDIKRIYAKVIKDR